MLKAFFGNKIKTLLPLKNQLVQARKSSKSPNKGTKSRRNSIEKSSANTSNLDIQLNIDVNQKTVTKKGKSKKRSKSVAHSKKGRSN